KAQASHDRLIGYARLALPIVALAVGFVLLRMLLSTVGGRGEAYRFLELQGTVPDGRGGMTMALPPGSQLRALPPPVLDESRSEIEERVTGLVSTQPQMAADVMAAWTKEDS